MRPTLPLLAILALSAPAPALGQVCAGLPLDERPVALSIGYAVSDGVNGRGAGADGRVAGSLVASAFVARYDYDDAEVNLLQAGAGLAREFGLGSASLCPRTTLAYAWPDDDRYAIDAWTGSGTVAVGHGLGLGGVRAIGFVDVGLAVTRAMSGGFTETTTDGVATIGATLAGSRLFAGATVDLTTADRIDPTVGLAVGVLLP